MSVAIIENSVRYSTRLRFKIKIARSTQLYDALLDDDNATRTRVAPQGFEDVVASNAEVSDDDTAPREALSLIHISEPTRPY